MDDQAGSRSEGLLPPHLDRAQWGRLIDSIGPASVLTLIESWMGDDLRHHCTPEDIWQETLLHAWRSGPQIAWRGRRHYRAWLLAIARNRLRDAADHLHAWKRGGHEEVKRFSDLHGVDPEVPAPEPLGDGASPAQLASEQEQAMSRALRELPPRFEAVVRLRLLEQRPMTTIAEQLHMPLSTAYYRLRAGLERLSARRACLTDA